MTEKIPKAASLTLGALLFLALLVSGTLALLQAPRLQVHFQWDGQAWQVRSALPPLERGDRLISLGGEPVTYETLLSDNAFLTSRQQFLSWLEQKEALYQCLQGRQVSAEVQRGRHRLSLELEITRNRWDFLGSSGLLHLPVSIAFLLVGWATYYRPGAGPQAFWFYGLCLSMSLVYLTNTLALLAQPVFYPPLYRAISLLNSACFVLAPALLLHFSLLLPRPRAPRWFLGLVYLSAAGVILSLSVPGQGVLVPLFFLGSLLAIAQGVWSYPGAIERQQMKWVGTGFMLGVGPWLLVNGLPLLWGGQRLMSDTIPGACLVFIPLSMAVAIHRYRLFDVGTFLEGTLVYLLTLALLVLCEVAVIAALGLTVALEMPLLLLTAVLAGFYGALRSRVASLIQRLFRRQPLDPQRALEGLRLRVAGLNSESILPALHSYLETLLGPQWIEPIDSQEAIGARLELADPPTCRVHIGASKGLHCGPLPAGRSYNSEVMQLLNALARQCALYYQRADLYELSLAQRQRSLEEREGLLRDLHDGVGAALASIRLLSQESRVSELAGDALCELQNFLYEGPEYTMERSVFLAELRTYGHRLFNHGDCQFDFDCPSPTQGLLPRSLALSVFRLYREALSNSLRHSQASHLKLRLHFFPDHLEMRIQDNGKGIEPGVCGRGLLGMKQRVAQLGGEMRWLDGPGANLEVSIPL
jgi:signal transduction histidine kinase